MGQKKRKLGMQSLEAKAMMAGDVGVNLSGGVLELSGDNASNHVNIQQLDADSYRVEGLGTSLNGQSTPLTLHGVKTISADMNGGDDRLSIFGQTKSIQQLDGDLKIEMGTGNDSVNVDGLWITGDASIVTDESLKSGRPQGADAVRVDDFNAWGTLNISTGGGSDDVSITADGWTVAYEGFGIDTGQGTKEADNVNLKNVFTWAGMEVDTSDGADRVTASNVLVYEGDFDIDTHGGNDSVTVRDSNMDWQLTNYNTSLKINTGSGNDHVVVENVTVRGNVEVSTESGADDVRIFNTHARDTIFASLGSGDDDLEIGKSSARSALLHGGSHYKGDDLDEYSNAFAYLNATGWES
ncbi:hypothetical protein Pla175_18970 [Pirellulimonas nuda]|uniref:Uncharacterized protein n=1 Tax=Pirellulimonas nuda TaxID=2528009 RepID=A0A518DAL4_9BACT|nr:hypothetical protein [Pirellulimonas nuda]QDU88519.1 hypothetical protein Pla175_18970 [Pirellulimonas nuda]